MLQLMTSIVVVMNKPNFKKNKVPKAVLLTPSLLKRLISPEEPKLNLLVIETYQLDSTILKESTVMQKIALQFPVVSKKKLDLPIHLLV